MTKNRFINIFFQNPKHVFSIRQVILVEAASLSDTPQKIKFYIKDFPSECD